MGLESLQLNCKDIYVQGNHFYAAAKINSVAELKRLLNTYKLDVNKRHYLGWTALHVAAVNRNYE
jgi:hypothetical protein